MINVILWILIGALAGITASRLLPHQPAQTTLIDSTAGILGALLGGAVFVILDTTPLDLPNVWGALIALLSASGAIVIVRSTLLRGDPSR